MTFEWKAHFQEHILFCGKEYAEDGIVEKLENSDSCIKAVVRGSDYYAVRIQFNGNNIEDMYCSCPYAAKGHACKHMAAVLFAVDRKMNQSSKNDHEDPENKNYCATREITDINELLDKATKDELIHFINELASGHEKIDNLIRVRFGKSISIGDMRELEREVDQILYRNSDRRGFINYHNAFDFQCDMSTFLQDKVQRLIDNDLKMEAFELSTYAFVKMGNCEIDDDGEISALSSEFYDLWKQIIKKCSETQRETIKDWFELHCQNGTVIDYLEDVLMEFLDNEFATEDDIKERIRNIDDQIDAARISRKCPRCYSVTGGYRSLLDERIELMQRTGASDEEIESYRKSNWDFDEVRNYYAKLAEKSGDYEEVIAINKESRLYVKDNPYIVHSYSEYIIDAYHHLGNKENELSERIQDFCNMGGTGLECFQKIRRLSKSEDWSILRDKLISFVKERDNRCEILAEEKLLDRLYECLFEKSDIGLINKYGFLLVEHYSEPILKEYAHYVEELAEIACNRSRYDELINYLKRMQNYKGGKQLVSSLASRWSEMYPTRKVMVKELLGFI